MKALINTACAIAASFGIMSPSQADAYPIDCAILLCMAGGFPSSPECGAAYAEVIRRVTPWPIEPPLQIWRCPMGSGGSLPITAPTGSLFGGSKPETPGADIPLDDAGFKFISEIKVYEIDHTWKREGSGPDKSCSDYGSTKVGFYGRQGEFYREPSSVFVAAEDTGISIPTGNCPSGRIRAVVIKIPEVDWETGAISYKIERFDY